MYIESLFKYQNVHFSKQHSNPKLLAILDFAQHLKNKLQNYCVLFSFLNIFNNTLIFFYKEVNYYLQEVQLSFNPSFDFNRAAILKNNGSYVESFTQTQHGHFWFDFDDLLFNSIEFAMKLFILV